jgi:hypothetical protein
LAIAQAAQRQLYRGLIRESRRTARVRIRELLVRAMVSGPSNRDQAKPDWITEDEIGEHVLDLLGQPTITDGESILILESPRTTV